MSYPYQNTTPYSYGPTAAAPYSPSPVNVRGFNAGRSFEFEDDVEFCPALTEEQIASTLNQAHMNGYMGSPYMSSPTNGVVRPAQGTPVSMDPQMYYSNAHTGSPVARGRRVEVMDPYGRRTPLAGPSGYKW
uniref:ARAD1A13464p n=1 Tax=Blastobotrys adeninivorans TaxID=409370 RepID=A0A060SXJ0_BLAAD